MPDEHHDRGSPPLARPPDWLRDAIRNALGELRSFGRTLWAITAHPMRFGRGWGDGTERALNPLAFLATAASLVAAAAQGLSWIVPGLTDDSSFGQQLLATVGPFLPYAAVGALAYIPLIAAAPRRRFLDVVAIGLYAGGPALVGYVLDLTGLAIHWLALGRPHVTAGLLMAMPPRARRLWLGLLWLVVVLFVRSFWLGLAGLYRGRWVACGVATILAVVALALALGRLERHGPFGIQLVIVHTASGWDCDLHD